MMDWIQRLEDGTPVIKRYYVLFIIVFSIGTTISYFVVNKLYEHSLDTRDNTIQSRDNTIANRDDKISDLKDSNKSLYGEIGKLEKEVITLKGSNELLQSNVGKLEKQIITLKGKAKKPVLTPKQIESKVRNWLEESDYSVRKVQDEKAHFRFDVKSSTGKQATIKLSKLQETFLTFQVIIIPVNKYLEAISKWDSKKLNDTLVNIKSSLVSIGIGFSIDTQLKWIILEEVLFVELLTQPDFFKACQHISTGQTMVLTFLHESVMITP